MTLWTQYGRRKAQEDYYKSCMLKILLLRALHATEK